MTFKLNKFNLIPILSLFIVLPSQANLLDDLFGSKNKPSTHELELALKNKINSYFDIKVFNIEANQNFGNEVEPEWGSRFNATLKINQDLYTDAGLVGKRVLIVVSEKKGTNLTVFGKSKSTLFQGKWKHTISIDGEPFSKLGKPFIEMSGDTLIKGSPEEIEMSKNFKKNLKQASHILKGSWKSKASKVTFNEDETYHFIHDFKGELKGKWYINKNLLTFNYNKIKTKNGQWKNDYRKADPPLKIISINNKEFVTHRDEIETWTRTPTVINSKNTQNTVFPWFFYENNYVFKQKYDALLNSHSIKGDWITRLKGVAAPLRKVSVEGREYDYFHSCKPHDCANNVIHILYEGNSKSIFAIYGLNEKGSFLGSNYPNTLQVKLRELSKLKLVEQQTNMPNSQSLKILQVEKDIKSYAMGLELFNAEQDSYPTTKEGIDALVHNPGNPKYKYWRQYLPKYKADPWGNNYQYLNPGVHGDFDLFSLGPDGIKSKDDIGNWQLFK